MVKSIDFVNQQVRKLLEKYKKEDFDIAQALMIEAGYKEGEEETFSSSFFSFLCERIYETAMQDKIIINNLYLIKHLPKKEYAYIGERGIGEGPRYKEIFPGILIYKSLLYKVLDKLGLTASKEAYINCIIVNEKELNEDRAYLLNYFSKEQIKRFKSFDIFDKTLKAEYEKKLRNKNKLIDVR